MKLGQLQALNQELVQTIVDFCNDSFRCKIVGSQRFRTIIAISGPCLIRENSADGEMVTSCVDRESLHVEIQRNFV